MIAEQSGQTD
jgi:MFS family permease